MERRPHPPADDPGRGPQARALTPRADVLQAGERRSNRIESLRALAALGVASYSLNLWQVPVLTALIDLGLASLALVAVPIAIAVALLSYRVVEAPFLRLRRRWSRFAAGQAEPPPPEPQPALGRFAGELAERALAREAKA